ncbi:MAG: hypothetical protein HY925_07855 [Elusimicrobia bacterium]|nr:hypothetical protein [Elusimicrobiota bacterium]
MGFFGKKTEAAAVAPAVKTAPAPAGAPAKTPSKKVWGVLLVLAAVMVLFFGGAVACLLYMRIATPPLAQVPARPVVKKKGAAAADAPPAQEPPKAEPPKVEEPKKAEAKAEPKAEPKAEAKTAAAKTPEPKAADRPTGSPAVHAAALPKHTAEPITASQKTEKAAPAASTEPKKVRAIAVEFTHSAPHAKDVQLRGAFLVRTGGKQSMVKDSSGVWKLSLSLLPGSYKYSFVVDGKRGANATKQVQ